MNAGEVLDMRRMRPSSGLSGSEVARDLLSVNDIHNVLLSVSSDRRNEYDPRKKLLSLSAAIYHRISIEATAIAAHEVGHALQDAAAYWPFRFRNAVLPVARALSIILPIALIVCILAGRSVVPVAAAYGLLILFHLLTLPIELDASRRALSALVDHGMIEGEDESEEAECIAKILRACAWAYFMAFFLAPFSVFSVLFRQVPAR